MTVAPADRPTGRTTDRASTPDDAAADRARRSTFDGPRASTVVGSTRATDDEGFFTRRGDANDRLVSVGGRSRARDRARVGDARDRARDRSVGVRSASRTTVTAAVRVETSGIVGYRGHDGGVRGGDAGGGDGEGTERQRRRRGCDGATRRRS